LSSQQSKVIPVLSQDLDVVTGLKVFPVTPDWAELTLALAFGD